MGYHMIRDHPRHPRRIPALRITASDDRIRVNSRHSRANCSQKKFSLAFTETRALHPRFYL